MAGQWKVLNEKIVLDGSPWLSVSIQKLKLPDGRLIDNYYQIYFPDAVVIVAITEGGKMVMSRQYLHGFRETSLVFPSGTVDPGEKPIETAKRELLEETGYLAGKWRQIGAYGGHSNYGCGRIYFFLCSNAKKVDEPSHDDLESMRIILRKEESVQKAIANGAIKAIGSITAFFLASLVMHRPHARRVHR